MSKKDPGAHQTHNRCHCFDHRKRPFAPRENQTMCTPAQSKRFIALQLDRGVLRIPSNRCVLQEPVETRKTGKDTPMRSGIGTQSAARKVWLTTSWPSPFPPRSGCVILVHSVAGMRLGDVL